MWPAAAFSVVEEAFRKNIEIWNLLKTVWTYICLTELLAVDKVRLHKNNE